jgi:integration host factor subunit beta
MEAAVLKKELIERIAVANPHLRGRDAERTVNTILQVITAAMARGDRVELRGIGAFSVRLRQGRSGRNPKSGAEVAVPEKRFPQHAKPYNLKITSFLGFRTRALLAPRPA